ncbi:hypothetical protein BD626DRAFT_539610 [Schizophyllum amplum]|uniref:RING-type domain-containing protein n=1 Tax=Schizophyllum amplum TaxID=97359 RepID=A0A550C2E8_9AGAR|nr:hypothetical protein BD626DRAFT_539610 [Auriculariopsis ampla]
MLAIAATSVCDVCLEPFNTERRALCSIPCGHAFCFDCLSRVKPECPLCRAPFDWSGILRLHIDLETPINSPQSSAGAPDSPSSAASASPDKQARHLQEAIVHVANTGASEERYRQLIAECRAFLKPLPKNSYQELRVSMRMMSYVYDIKREHHLEKQRADELGADRDRLYKEVSRLTKKIADLEAVNKEEKDQAIAAQGTLQAKVDQMLQMMASEFAQLRTMAHSTQPLPPENASMSEMLDATQAYSGPESIDNERLLSAFMSPMPVLTPALARPLDEPAGSPALSDGDMGGEHAVKCAAVGHPYSCHCVPCNVFAEEAPAEDDAAGRATRANSRAPSRRASTKRLKSGLSLTAPGQDRFAEGDTQERPSSSAAGRHGRMRSVTVGVREDVEDNGDGNPVLRNRLHDLLNDPSSLAGTPSTVSASMPVLSSMPARMRPVVPHSSLSAIPDASAPMADVPPRPTTSAAPSSSLLSSALRPQRLGEAPTEPTTATSNVTSGHATPQRRQTVSHASKAAMALEQTQRERMRAERQDREPAPLRALFPDASRRENAEPTPEDHAQASQPIPIQTPPRQRSDTTDYACGSLRDYSSGSFRTAPSVAQPTSRTGRLPRRLSVRRTAHPREKCITLLSRARLACAARALRNRPGQARVAPHTTKYFNHSHPWGALRRQFACGTGDFFRGVFSKASLNRIL